MFIRIFFFTRLTWKPCLNCFVPDILCVFVGLGAQLCPGHFNRFCSWILSPRVCNVDLCLGILRRDFFFFPLSFPRQSQTLISLSNTKEKFYFISTSGALCACFWCELYFLVSGYGLLKIQFIGHQVTIDISMAVQPSLTSSFPSYFWSLRNFLSFQKSFSCLPKNFKLFFYSNGSIWIFSLSYC